VHAQRLGRLELVPLVLSQGRKNEDLLELAQPFRVSNAALVHLQGEILELNLHGNDLFSVRSSTLHRTGKSFPSLSSCGNPTDAPPKAVEQSRKTALPQ
jgi:hypothetical protein